MKRVLTITAAALMLIGCGKKDETKTEAAPAAVVKQETPARPSDAELHAYKVFHHTRYKVETAAAAGGTNKLLHTKKLPTEGKDAVVTPALDHLYSKAVLDLTEGPVTVEFPAKGVIDDRYWSIHITDQEHYTIFDEFRPVGKYTFVRNGKDMKVPEGSTVINCRGDYPHLFIRIQMKNEADMQLSLAAQETVKLTGVSKEYKVENYVKHVLETHDIYEQNKGMLDSVVDFSIDDYNRVTDYIGVVAPKFANNLGFFGPIDSKEAGSNDPENRAAAIFGHLGLPAEHAVYIPYFVNCNGERLSGDNVEKFTFAYEPEGVKEFWSVTRYNLLTRNTIAGKNDVFNAYNTKPDADGNVTITFSAEDPKDGTYWMPVVVGQPYYFVGRYYKADLNNLPSSCK
jgi:hypothetical protein